MWEKLRLHWHLRGTTLLKRQLYKSMCAVDGQIRSNEEKLLRMLKDLSPQYCHPVSREISSSPRTISGAFRQSRLIISDSVDHYSDRSKPK